MSKLALSTKKSLYPAIPIEIDGKLYPSRKFTHALLLTIAPLEKKLDVADPDWDSLCDWMLAVFGVEKEITEQLEKDEVEDIYVKVKVELLRRQKTRMKKSIDAVKGEMDDIEESVNTAGDVKKTAEEIAKNVKRPGKKK